MNTGKQLLALGIALLLTAAAAGCGGQAQPAQKEGVVYLDPNAAAGTGAQGVSETLPEPGAPGPEASADPAGDTGDVQTPELYFELKGVRLEPWMEAAPALAALGEPIGRFEADSCAYVGKDLFYYYPSVQLTVNQVEGVERITAISVTDDLVTTPQGLRINDEEDKLLSLMGGETDDDVYIYRNGRTQLLIQVKQAEDDVRRITAIEYRVAADP